MDSIKVIIADDHAIVRQGIMRVLNDQDDIQIIGEAENGIQALELCKNKKPDVLLLDIAMPELSGLEAIDQLKNGQPDLAIIVITMYDNEKYIQKLLQSGALGYVLKASDPEEISHAIRAVYKGEYFLSEEIKKKVITSYIKNPAVNPRATRYESLSDQEKQVFQLLVLGKSTKEISDKLNVSVKTVEKHRTAISQKFGTNNRVHLSHYAVKNEIINLDLLEI
jgi:DNA-binding NarL/FixJ family response regulator